VLGARRPLLVLENAVCSRTSATSRDEYGVQFSDVFDQIVQKRRSARR
jgi:hypothetical protein